MRATDALDPLRKKKKSCKWSTCQYDDEPKAVEKRTISRLIELVIVSVECSTVYTEVVSAGEVRTRVQWQGNVVRWEALRKPM